MNWFQILFPLALILAPVIGQIVKKANEMAEQKRVEQERAKLREDALRTGRGPEAPQRQARPAPQVQGGAVARSNLEEIARRRQAELQELRRRQLAARGQAPQQTPQQAPQPMSQRTVAPPRPTQAPQPPRPPQPVQPPRPQRAPTPAQRSRPTSRPQPQRPVRQRLSRERPKAESPTPRLGSRRLGSLEATAFEPETQAKKTVTLPTNLDGWRQAIVLNEILSPPMAMRPDRE